jgi:hypothetical protein
MRSAPARGASVTWRSRPSCRRRTARRSASSTTRSSRVARSLGRVALRRGLALVAARSRGTCRRLASPAHVDHTARVTDHGPHRRPGLHARAQTRRRAHIHDRVQAMRPCQAVAASAVAPFLTPAPPAMPGIDATRGSRSAESGAGRRPCARRIVSGFPRLLEERPSRRSAASGCSPSGSATSTTLRRAAIDAVLNPCHSLLACCDRPRDGAA